MAFKTGVMGNGRNFGLHGGPGKGSKPRVSNRKAFLENYSGIAFTGSLNGFTKKGTKLVKKYS